jgi:hypothetical protein
MEPGPSEVTRCADALARAVGALLPHHADPLLLAAFQAALSDMIAATIGGASSMAAGAVVSVDDKVNQLINAVAALAIEIEQLKTSHVPGEERAIGEVGDGDA